MGWCFLRPETHVLHNRMVSSLYQGMGDAQSCFLNGPSYIGHQCKCRILQDCLLSGYACIYEVSNLKQILYQGDHHHIVKWFTTQVFTVGCKAFVYLRATIFFGIWGVIVSKKKVLWQYFSDFPIGQSKILCPLQSKRWNVKHHRNSSISVFFTAHFAVNFGSINQLLIIFCDSQSLCFM